MKHEAEADLCIEELAASMHNRYSFLACSDRRDISDDVVIVVVVVVVDDDDDGNGNKSSWVCVCYIEGGIKRFPFGT